MRETNNLGQEEKGMDKAMTEYIVSYRVGGFGVTTKRVEAESNEDAIAKTAGVSIARRGADKVTGITCRTAAEHQAHNNACPTQGAVEESYGTDEVQG